MSLYKQKLNTRTGAFNLVPSNAVISFKPAVASEANLPTEGNEENDARLTNDTQNLYVWNGIAWINQGDIVDLTWAAISGRPSSSVADIDDAVSKKHANTLDHTQNTDVGFKNNIITVDTITGYTRILGDVFSVGNLKFETNNVPILQVKNGVSGFYDEILKYGNTNIVTLGGVNTNCHSFVCGGGEKFQIGNDGTIYLPINNKSIKAKSNSTYYLNLASTDTTNHIIYGDVNANTIIFKVGGSTNIPLEILNGGNVKILNNLTDGTNSVSIVEIKDAINNKHTQNTDTILTTDGAVELINAGLLKSDLKTDRWLISDTNTFLGVGVVGAGNLSHTAGNTGLRHIAIGYRAMYSATTGQDNVAIGYEALYSMTNSSGLVAIGFQALRLNTSGCNNVAIGQSALYTNGLGSNNVAIGMEALYGGTQVNAVAIGYQAGRTNTGVYLLAIGYQAGKVNTGANNTFIGYQSGIVNTSGLDNTAIGYSACYSMTQGSYNIAIGSRALYSSNNSLARWNVAIGVDALSNYTQPSGNVAIGYEAAKMVSINESVMIGFRNSANATHALTSVGYFAGNTSSGAHSTFLGYRTGQDNRGAYAISIGFYTGQSNTGANSILVGYRAGETNTGNDCICLGYEAGKSNSTANQFIIQQTNINATPLIQGDFATGNIDIAGELKIKVYSQIAEPTLSADQRCAYWIDTDDSNRVYLLFRRGTADQVKMELT